MRPPNIPTPKELLADQQDIVRGHVDLLATRLRATKPIGRSFTVDKHGVPHEHHAAVAREFELCGWAVKWHDSQHDGTSVEFTARP